MSEDSAVDEEVPGADLHGWDHRHAGVEVALRAAASQGVGAQAALSSRPLPRLEPRPLPPGPLRAPDVNLGGHQGAPPLQALAHRPL